MQEWETRRGVTVELYPSQTQRCLYSLAAYTGQKVTRGMLSPCYCWDRSYCPPSKCSSSLGYYRTGGGCGLQPTALREVPVGGSNSRLIVFTPDLTGRCWGLDTILCLPHESLSTSVINTRDLLPREGEMEMCCFQCLGRGKVEERA